MVRVRKEVEGPDSAEPVTALTEQREIAGEGHRIARDVHELRGPESGEGRHDVLTRPGPRRVEHDRRALQPCALGAPPGKVAVNAGGHRTRTGPLSEVPSGVASRAFVALHRLDSDAAAEPVADRGGQKAHPAVQVEVHRRRVETVRVDRGLHRFRECGGRVPVHLPEPVRMEVEVALPDTFGDRLAPLAVGEHDDRAQRRGDDAKPTRGRIAEARSSRDLRYCQGEVCDRDDAMRPCSVRAEGPVGGRVKTNAGAPSGAVCRAAERLDGDLVIDAGHPVQRVGQHLPFELPLVRELDVTELGAARALLRRAVERRGRPHVRLPVRGRPQHLDGVGAPELRLRVIGHDRTDELAGDRIRDEDHPPLVPGDHDPAVGYVGDLQLDELAQRISHPPSLGAAVSETAVRLYLASTSPARLATLRAAGVEPIVTPSRVDEDAVVAAAGTLTAADTVLFLARAKAEAVSRSAGPDADGVPDGFVLGGDSVFELDGAVYGKPLTASVARERWELQRGRTGVLHSGHWLIDQRGGVVHGAAGAVSSASVTFAGDVTDTELEAYIATGEPLNVAGAFTIDSLGAPFITAVQGDPHTVVGLSLSTLRSLLRGFGVEWHELARWR